MPGSRKTANGEKPRNGDRPQGNQKPRRDARGGGGGGFAAAVASPFRKIGTFLREVRIETGRVVWPSREETYTYTVVVVVAVMVVAAWVGALDSLLSNLISALNVYK